MARACTTPALYFRGALGVLVRDQGSKRGNDVRRDGRVIFFASRAAAERIGRSPAWGGGEDERVHGRNEPPGVWEGGKERVLTPCVADGPV